MNKTKQIIEKHIAIIIILMIIALSACKKENPIKLSDFPIEDSTEFSPTPYQIEIPPFFPTDLNIPADNPMTVEGVELGRYLFYDGRLAGRTHSDSLMSCATCHLQANSFECGIGHPIYQEGFTHGINGKPTPHVMLPLMNLVFNSNGYLWNGMVSNDNPNEAYRNIEDLVWMGIVAEHEMNSDTNRAKKLLQSIPEYPPMFKKAFGTDTITIRLVGKAIAQFIRTLISANSKFDRYLRGEEMLTISELNGFILFTTEEGADCFHCHGGGGNPLFTTNGYYNNGKDTLFDDPRDRFHVTGDPMHKGAYRAPSLRNIRFTGPYMHDGRFSTLEEVIEFYNSQLIWSPYIDPLMHKINDGGAQLLPSEINDLMNFIKTLEDTSFINNTDYSNPFEH